VAAGSETPVNIKAEANKTSFARNLKIITATTLFYVENESSCFVGSIFIKQ
jgi:hypothetical protein